MILRKLSEISGASHADLKESLVWWLKPKFFLGRTSESGPQHQKAMIAALTAELRRIRKTDETP